jgi:hypothetical protein
MKAFVHVLEARHIDSYRIWLQFNDGTEGEVDLEKELYGKVFDPLKNVENFKNFEIVGHTLAWPNGADFAPEFLKTNLESSKTRMARA